MSNRHNPSTIHACGGTILAGDDHAYCETCGAFAYDGEPVPNGTDKAANQEAWDSGDSESPSAEAGMLEAAGLPT